MGGRQGKPRGADVAEGVPFPDWIDFRHFEEIDSTQSFVEQQYESFDQGKLTVVSADFQTSGRGTRDRKWEASRGRSVLMTFFFRFPADRPTSFVNSNVANVTKVLSVATVEALQSAAVGHLDSLGKELHFGVKWPNDVVVNRQKIGGILARAVPSPGGRLDGVIIGVGVNVNTPRGDLDRIGRPVWPATSLRAETGQVYDLAGIRRRVIANFAGELPLFFDLGFAAFRKQVNELEVLMGSRVRFRVHDDEEVDGVFRGVDDAGHILLLLSGGEERSYPAGEIVPGPAV